jgi:hypothetical protein
MKKMILLGAFILCAAMVVPAQADDRAQTAFLGDNDGAADDIVILGPKDVLALDDQKLLDVYIDAVVEIQASNLFHATSGFTPKDYKKYKALLKYRLQLLIEIHRRKIEMPAEIK